MSSSKVLHPRTNATSPAAIAGASLVRGMLTIGTGELRSCTASLRHSRRSFSSSLMGGLLIVVGMVAASAPAVAAELVGRVRVIDGDTIAVGGVHVRLQGIAAPEVPHHGLPGEPGGPEARDFLRGLAEGRIAVCELTGERTWGRQVGVCRVDGRDVAEEVIAAGLARDCPRFSKGRYAAVERPEAAGLPFPGYCVPRGR